MNYISLAALVLIPYYALLVPRLQAAGGCLISENVSLIRLYNSFSSQWTSTQSQHANRLPENRGIARYRLLRFKFNNCSTCEEALGFTPLWRIPNFSIVTRNCILSQLPSFWPAKYTFIHLFLSLTESQHQHVQDPGTAPHNNNGLVITAGRQL